jgi:hypothetical protein
MARFLHSVIVAAAIVATAHQAVAKDVYAWATIMDAETGRRLYGSTIKVIDDDSGKLLNTSQDTPPELYQTTKESKVSIGFWASTDSMNLRLVVTRQDYKPTTQLVKYPRDIVNYQLRDTIWMVPNDCELDAQTLIKLREVTVTATKVKMVMSGDTIVYNADAFNLPEGSLLDALVSQLPGVTLSSNGQIRVNGEYVSELLVDGKDFFKGDATVALNNLPAYIVKKIQVYRRDEFNGIARLSASRKDNLPLVMDVRLKPQYQKGFIGNISAGYGTSGRYVAKGFLMEYTRNGRIAAYGQTNNINSEAAGPASNSGAEWSESTDRTGSRRITKTGLDFQWGLQKLMREDFPYNTHFDIRGNATYQHNRNTIVSRSASDLFLPESNRYARSSSTNLSSEDRVRSNISYNLGMLPLRGNACISAYIKTGFTFDHVDSRSNSQEVQFAKDPDGASIKAVIDSINGNISADYGTRHQAIYLDQSRWSEFSRNYSAFVDATVPLNTDITKSTSDISGYCANISWNFYNRNGYTRSLQNVTYPDAASNISNGQYRRRFSNSWQITPSIKQEVHMPHYGTFLIFEEGYTHQQQHGWRPVWNVQNPFSSLEDEVRDAINSYSSDLTTDKYFLNLSFDWFINEHGSALFKLESSAINDHLIYSRGDINADVSRLRWKFEPSLSGRYEFNNNKARQFVKWDASLRRGLPDMITLLPTTDNTNPLTISLGNPDLRPSTTLNTYVHLERTAAASGFVTAGTLRYNRYWNRRSTRRTYDSTTGVSTYTPVNVNGAYDINGNVYITAKLDHDNRLWLTSSTSATYEHIPDWMQENGGSDVMSTVRNTLLSQRFQLNWSIASGYSMNFGIKGTWRNATSPMASFTTINAADLYAKLGVQVKLPWKLQLGTDMTLYKRYGYGDASLNDASWVWNANLTRSFLSGRFLASVTAFDILGQLNHISASINSLGRTETWTNALRRYAMLTLTYRFSLMPRTAGGAN